MPRPDLLDDDLLDAPWQPQPAPRPYRGLPLILLTFGSIFTLLFNGNIWQLVQLGFVLSLVLLPYRYQVVMVVSLYLLGVIGILRIFPISFGFHLSFFFIDLLCLGGLILTLYIGYLELAKLMRQWRGTVDPIAAQQDRYQYFRQRFARRTTVELQGYLRNERLTEEARQAVQDILSERDL